MPLRPVGTTEARGANIAGFARPYGTHTITIASIPSSELLGYCQASLRDEQTFFLISATGRLGDSATRRLGFAACRLLGVSGVNPRTN